jgi:hypothetical protein
LELSDELFPNDRSCPNEAGINDRILRFLHCFRPLGNSMDTVGREGSEKDSLP